MRKRRFAAMLGTALILSTAIAGESWKIESAGDFPGGTVTYTGDVTVTDSPAGRTFDFSRQNAMGCVSVKCKKFNPDQVCISFWLSPVNWTPKDGKFHIFAFGKSADGNGEFNLYRYGNPDMNSDGLSMAFLQQDKNSPPPGLIGLNLPNRKIGDEWREKSWHYFCFISNHDQLALYIDGDLVGMSKGRFAMGEAPEFRFGPSWGDFAHTRIADLRISSEIPDEAAISAEFDRVMSRLAEEKK